MEDRDRPLDRGSFLAGVAMAAIVALLAISVFATGSAAAGWAVTGFGTFAILSAAFGAAE